MVYFWDNILEVVSIQWNELGLQRFAPIRRYIGRIKQQKMKREAGNINAFFGTNMEKEKKK